MGGKTPGLRRLRILVADPGHVPDLLDFLHRADYAAERLDHTRIEATGPSDWPGPLAEAALHCLLVAWRKGHPEVDATLESELVSSRPTGPQAESVRQ